MRPTSLRRAAVVTVAGAALAVAAPLAASAADQHPAAHATATAGATGAAATATSTRAAARLVVRSGATVLTLAPATAAALAHAGVSVAAVSEARVGKTGISFPVTGGLLNPTSLAGTVRHNGGLTFTAGGKSITVRDFLINTGSGRLSAYVDQAGVRIDLLDLSLAKATVARHGDTLVVGKVRASLDRSAASALDAYFRTTLFAAGLPIGSAKVSAQVTPVALG